MKTFTNVNLIGYNIDKYYFGAILITELKWRKYDEENQYFVFVNIHDICFYIM